MRRRPWQLERSGSGKRRPFYFGPVQAVMPEDRRGVRARPQQKTRGVFHIIEGEQNLFAVHCHYWTVRHDNILADSSCKHT